MKFSETKTKWVAIALFYMIAVVTRGSTQISGHNHLYCNRSHLVYYLVCTME